MNYLQQYFENNDKRLIDKWMHYFEVYDRHFSKYRGKEVHILEIGVSQGGSLQMWKDYFGDKAKIYGIDVNPACKELEEENIQIFIGSQGDRKFLKEVKSKIPHLDILIDDGSHKMKHQIISYEELIDHVKEDGVYLCEDVHTSYRLKFGGGFKRAGTYIEYTKNFIDYLNAYHSEQRSLKVNDFTKSVHSVHFYDSIVVLEKRPMGEPIRKRSGVSSVPHQNPPSKSALVRARKKISYWILSNFNKLLRFFRIRGVILR